METANKKIKILFGITLASLVYACFLLHNIKQESDKYKSELNTLKEKNNALKCDTVRIYYYKN